MENSITGDRMHADAAALMRDAWLRLAHTPGGPGRTGARALLACFGLPQHILAAGRAGLSARLPLLRGVQAARCDALLQAPSPAMRQLMERTSRWLEHPDHALLTLADAGYPQALLATADPPLLLYASGRHALLARPAVAVVGSRNASRQGVQHAAQFSAALSNAGWTVVSGLAMGIDSAAHEGGLLGCGSTVAVVGTGIDLVYPARNRALADRVAQDGCVVSEFALGTPPLAGNFPRRNRIISGLSRGVLVIEAALQSGSLITAAMAAEQGREVFAIPGAINAPLSKGCHHLIRQGAKLVDTVQDILDELGEAEGWPVAANAGTDAVTAVDTAADTAAGDIVRKAALAASAASDNTALLQCLGHAPVTLDALAQCSGRDPARLLGDLLTLELAGRLEILPGGTYRRLA